jgi:hypothetical protein
VEAVVHQALRHVLVGHARVVLDRAQVQDELVRAAAVASAVEAILALSAGRIIPALLKDRLLIA